MKVSQTVNTRVNVRVVAICKGAQFQKNTCNILEQLESTLGWSQMLTDGRTDGNRISLSSKAKQSKVVNRD